MTKLFCKKEFNEVISLLSNEEVVAFPTDTVFGIGVIYNSEKAVNKMKQAKQRDERKPFPLMVANVDQLEQVAEISDRERIILEAFTPGALTLVLKRKDTIRKELVNGFDTIAIRIPDDAYVLRLLRKVGPMFVTSANLADHPAANTHEEVMAQLDGRIAAVVRGKSFSHVASTIVDCSGPELKCLREGEIPFEDILAEVCDAG